MREKPKKGTRLIPGIPAKIPAAKSGLLVSTRRAIARRFPSNSSICRSGCLIAEFFDCRWTNVGGNIQTQSNKSGGVVAKVP